MCCWLSDLILTATLGLVLFYQCFPYERPRPQNDWLSVSQLVNVRVRIWTQGESTIMGGKSPWVQVGRGLLITQQVPRWYLWEEEWGMGKGHQKVRGNWRKGILAFHLNDLASFPRARPNCLRLKEQVKDTMPQRKSDGQARQGGDQAKWTSQVLQISSVLSDHDFLTIEI